VVQVTQAQGNSQIRALLNSDTDAPLERVVYSTTRTSLPRRSLRQGACTLWMSSEVSGQQSPSNYKITSVLKLFTLLEELGVDEDIVYAVKAHNECHGLPRESLLDKALWAVDPLTGLLVAAALIHPEKKLGAIDVGFVINRFKESSFARGANRDQMKSCLELGLALEEFIEIALEAMQIVSSELGL
jgi:hypothetical protein